VQSDAAGGFWHGDQIGHGRLGVCEHHALHSDMNDFLQNVTDEFGNSMRPTSANKGADVRANFSRADRLNALSKFYTGSGAKYTQAAADFFAQNPDVCP